MMKKVRAAKPQLGQSQIETRVKILITLLLHLDALST
jgi:hypothetical protein